MGDNRERLDKLLDELEPTKYVCIQVGKLRALMTAFDAAQKTRLELSQLLRLPCGGCRPVWTPTVEDMSDIYEDLWPAIQEAERHGWGK